MLKPGQLFTNNGNVYQVTKGTFETTLGSACPHCRLRYNRLLKRCVPCETYKHFPCVKYCGLYHYPKLVKLCGRTDNV